MGTTSASKIYAFSCMEYSYLLKLLIWLHKLMAQNCTKYNWYYLHCVCVYYIYIYIYVCVCVCVCVCKHIYICTHTHTHTHTQTRRSQSPRGLRRGSAAAHLLGLWVWIPPKPGCLSVVRVVCCHVEVSATRWSLEKIIHTYHKEQSPGQLQNSINYSCLRTEMLLAVRTTSMYCMAETHIFQCYNWWYICYPTGFRRNQHLLPIIQNNPKAHLDVRHPPLGYSKQFQYRNTAKISK